MAIYHLDASKLIARIEVKSPRPGIEFATIHTKPNASPEELEKLRLSLGDKNISTLMDMQDGKPALQIRGMKNAESLLAALQETGHATGAIRKETTPEDNKKVSFMDRVRGKALFLSAIFYNLGNIAFFVSAVQRGRHNRDGKMAPNDKSEFMIGAAFSLGDVLMTAYGHDRGDEELTAAANGLKRHLHQKGIEIPQGNALNPDSLHQSGAMKATDRWLRKHIGHIKCLTELAGGLFTMHAALKKDKKNNINQGKLAAGFLIATAWAATFLLDKPRGHNIFDGEKDEPVNVAGHMKENPRAWIARPLAIGNNFANLWGALNPYTGERKRFRDEVVAAQARGNAAEIAYTTNKQHDYIYNVFSACAFMIAHLLFGLSGSKRPKETEDDKTMMNDLVLLSANLLAKQPGKLSDAVISETADYVSKLSHVRMGKEKVAEAIRVKIQDLSQSAWAGRVNAQPTLPRAIT